MIGRRARRLARPARRAARLPASTTAIAHPAVARPAVVSSRSRINLNHPRHVLIRRDRHRRLAIANAQPSTDPLLQRRARDNDDRPRLDEMHVSYAATAARP